jgi:hypothetical protein
MKLKKETLGTYVYADDTEDTVIPQLYIKKSAFEKPPKKIKVTVQAIKPVKRD